MPFEIIALLLFAALVHAVWNSFIKGAQDSVAIASWIYIGGGVIMAPALAFLPALPAKGWALVAGHFVLHMFYKVLLISMYREGDFSRVFPIARGSAPALVTLAAIPVAGELPPPAALAGIGVVCLGLIVFAVEPRALERASRRTLLLAGAAGVVVSAYTIIDALGVRLPEAAMTYVVLLFVFDGLGMVALGLYWRGARLWPAMGATWKTGLPTVCMSVINFCAVLWVLSFSPMGPVTAVRETSIVFAALIGAYYFRESFGPRRIAAAAIIAAGIALLNLGG